MREDRERLQDMAEAIAQVERYAVRGKAEFLDNELIQTWVLFHLQVIGEAARSLTEQTRSAYSEVEWRDIIDFRNLLVHEYFRVDLELVWAIVAQELPILKDQVDRILANR
ncbi:MAG: DUF86 domain-containing protein [Cyanophyceae cyanobacterium]